MPRHYHPGQRKCREKRPEKEKVDPLLALIHAFLNMYMFGGDQTLTLKTTGEHRNHAAKQWWNYHRQLAGKRSGSVPCYCCGAELKMPHKARKGEDTGIIGHIVPRDTVLRLAKKGDPVAYAHGETLMNLVPTCRKCEESTGKGILTLSNEGRRKMDGICKRGKCLTTSVHKKHLFCTFK